MDPPVSKKQKIMGSEMQTRLEGMQTVTDMQFLPPIDRFDQTTTRLVLQKTLSLCGIPRRSTEDRSAEEVKSEQKSLRRQLKALQKKKEEDAEILSAHEEVETKRAALMRNNELIRRNMVKCNEFLVHLEQSNRRNDYYRATQSLLQSKQRRVLQNENLLKNLESPLRN